MSRSAALSVLFMLVLASGAGAQTVSSTTGAIDGRVTDASNAVLPGVTVTLAGAAMMGTRNTVTSETGTFRFISITPGLYTVTFELGGFATVKRTDIQVGAGFTATLNMTMNVASLEESVTVSGASPVVDTQSTTVTTSFDAAKLAALPNGSNDPWAMLAETPAVKMTRIDVGGSTSGTQTTFTAYGTAGQRPYYEGINGTEFTNANGNYPDMNAFDEVAVNTVANNAEMGPPGVMMVFVVKSGGNAYHGSAGINYSNGDWQSFNIDADQIARGVEGGGGLNPEDTNRLTLFRDSFAQLGGYIQKDKLWWFGAIRESENQLRQTNFPVKPFLTTLQVYQGKAHVSAVAEQQDHRLLPVQREAAAGPARSVPVERDQRDPPERRLAVQTVSREFRGERRVQLCPQRRHVPRGAGRAVGLLPRVLQRNNGAELRGHHHPHRVGRGSEPVRPTAPQPGPRIAELLQGRVRRHAQLEVRVGNLPRDEHRGVLHGRSVQRRRAHPSQRRAAGSLPARQPGRVDRGPLEHGPLRDRHVAGQQQAHAEPRPPVRSVTRTSSPSRGTKRIPSSRRRWSFRPWTTCARGTWRRRALASATT